LKRKAAQLGLLVSPVRRAGGGTGYLAHRQEKLEEEAGQLEKQLMNEKQEAAA
jgi:hypothetical protein